MDLSQENRLVAKLMQLLTILGFHLHCVLVRHLWMSFWILGNLQLVVKFDQDIVPLFKLLEGCHYILVK